MTFPRCLVFQEQGLFSNISMDSLDCSSFEADEFLPSLDADGSSSGALPTSEDGALPSSGEAAAMTCSDAGATCSDAAAVTTSGDLALVTSEDATDPATAPSGERNCCGGCPTSAGGYRSLFNSTSAAVSFWAAASAGWRVTFSSTPISGTNLRDC